MIIIEFFIQKANLLEVNHVNVIESFLAFTKKRLSKFNDLTDEKFILHLKESEFKWNSRKDNLYKIMLKLVKKFGNKVI